MGARRLAAGLGLVWYFTRRFVVTPDEIAQPILDALGRRQVTLPGGLSRMLRGAVAPLPRRARAFGSWVA